MVFVLNVDGSSLMPCENSVGRLLLKQGKAKVKWRTPFTIKLTKDAQGTHHWIPLDWVTRVDDHVHIDRPGDQARREWLAAAPEWETSAPAADAVTDWRADAGSAIGPA